MCPGTAGTSAAAALGTWLSSLDQSVQPWNHQGWWGSDHSLGWALSSPGYGRPKEQPNNAKRGDYPVSVSALVEKALLQPAHGPRHYKTDIVSRDYAFQCSLQCVSTFLSVYVAIKQHAQGYKNSLEVIDMLIMLNQVNNARVTSS